MGARDDFIDVIRIIVHNNAVVTEPNMDSGMFVLRALLVAATSALGSVPIFFLGDTALRHIGPSISVAAGMMTGCSIVLCLESILASSWLPALCGVMIGVALIMVIEYIFKGREDLSFCDVKGASAAKVLVIFFSMLIHSVGEGLSIGISALHEENQSLNLVVLFSLAIHNIPEGMAICMAFVAKGMSIGQGAMCAILSNLPQPLAALLAYWGYSSNAAYVPLGLGMASGAMAYVVFQDLVPEACEKLTFCRVVAIMIPSCLCVMALDAFSHFGGLDFVSGKGGEAAQLSSSPGAEL